MTSGCATTGIQPTRPSDTSCSVPACPAAGVPAEPEV